MHLLLQYTPVQTSTYQCTVHMCTVVYTPGWAEGFFAMLLEKGGRSKQVSVLAMRHDSKLLLLHYCQTLCAPSAANPHDVRPIGKTAGCYQPPCCLFCFLPARRTKRLARAGQATASRPSEPEQEPSCSSECNILPLEMATLKMRLGSPDSSSTTQAASCCAAHDFKQALQAQGELCPRPGCCNPPPPCPASRPPLTSLRPGSL